jgi:hypothetical protein
MGIEDVKCPECRQHKSTLEFGSRGMCLDCEAENEHYDRFHDERVRTVMRDEGE